MLKGDQGLCFLHRIKEHQQEPRSCGWVIGRHCLGCRRAGGAAERRGEVRKTTLRKRMVMLLIASPRFTVLLTVQASISFSARQQPACRLLFPCCQWGTRGSERWWWRKPGSLPRVLLPCVPSGCRAHLLPHLISPHQGAGWRWGPCYGISGVSQVLWKHTNLPV